MGWYDAFGGHTERIDIGRSYATGSAAKNFGDAFASIGGTLIAADAQAGKNKLLEMQLQNEQNKLEDAANTRADKNTQEYAEGFTRKGFEAQKQTDLSTLDTSASPEAALNAQQAINAFYTPTKAMKQEWAAQEKVAQDTNDKSYLNDAFKLDPTATKEARQNADDALRSFYNPSSAQTQTVEDRFKAQELIAQTKFNDEGIGVSVSGGFNDYASFVKGNPEIVKNIDGATEKSIKLYFDDMSKAKSDKEREDAKLALEKRKVAVQENTLAQSKYEFTHPQPKATTQAEQSEAQTKVLKAVNDMVVTQYGKTDNKGFTAIDPTKGEEAKWVHTRTVSNIANFGMDAATAFNKAQLGWNDRGKKIAKEKAVTADPLGLR